jgi:hypothetical protein
MNTQEVITAAASHLIELAGHQFDVLHISKPPSVDAALNLAKVLSKLSPLVGNLIEFNAVEYLNDREEYREVGRWVRQDPGFPDTIFEGVSPTPGVEIKAWFPLATEITGRFRDSQNAFDADQTYVAVLAWLPDKLLYGVPLIIDVCVVSGRSVAADRDEHYHDPPDYLVIEPEDTTSRTVNLQQTNTNGYKFQGTSAQFAEARRVVESWGPDGPVYRPTREYQQQLRELLQRYPYRLDTNYAKMDRIEHAGIEEFKRRVLGTTVNGMTVFAWDRLLRGENESAIVAAIQEHLGITEDEGSVPLS